MAQRYAALIRGINVGRAKRVAMADLREIVADLGYSDVSTVLNSGNVVFTSDDSVTSDVAARLQAALATRLRVEARVTVVGASGFDAAVGSNPLLDIAENPSRLLVVFPASPADFNRLRPIADTDWRPEALVLGRGVAFMWCPLGVTKSRAAQALSVALGDSVTSRNWTTVLKIQALVHNPQ